MLSPRAVVLGALHFVLNPAGLPNNIAVQSGARRVGNKNLYDNFGIREITFWDDNFLVNEQWVFEFCDLLDASGLKIPWSACGRVNTVTKAMLERAKKSGLWCVFYGFETGNEDLLLRIKKGATLEQARQAARWTLDLGIDIRGSFMLGLPGETPLKAMNTINFARELKIPFAQFLLTFRVGDELMMTLS